MKTTVSVLALAAGAAATFKGASPFTCPGNTDNKCTDTQKPGYDFGDLPFGGFSEYKDFNWYGGWSCGSSSGKRFAPRTFGSNYVGATCGSSKSNSPSFGCGANVDKFSLGGMHITPEFDCDLEFHYDMPDGSTCKHRNSCSSKGSTITNTQCGGAKNVTIVYPPQPNKPKSSCSVDIHTITFDCNSASSTSVRTTKTTSVKTTTTPTSVKTTTTPKETTTSPTKESTTSPKETTTSPKETTTSPKESTTSPKETSPATSPASQTPPHGNSTTVRTTAPTTAPTTKVETTETSTTQLTTSTIFTTSTQTITSCAASVTNCPAESQKVTTTVVTVAVSTTVCPVTETAPVSTPKVSSPATTTTPSTPVETLPCPEVVPKCFSTFLFTTGCSDNTDSACYCPNEIFIKSVFDCVYAHGETDEIVSESVIYIQGLCAPHVPENPAIATGATCTSYVTPTITVTQPAVYTTVTVDTTTVVPCTNEAGEVIPSSSSTAVIQTTLTVPQIGFTSEGSSVGIVPVTSYPAAATTPPVVATTKASTGFASPSGVKPSASSTGVVVSGSNRVGAGFGFALAVMGLVAAL